MFIVLLKKIYTCTFLKEKHIPIVSDNHLTKMMAKSEMEIIAKPSTPVDVINDIKKPIIAADNIISL